MAQNPDDEDAVLGKMLLGAASSLPATGRDLEKKTGISSSEQSEQQEERDLEKLSRDELEVRAGNALSRAMMELSQEDRNLLYQEIHGVEDHIVETPERIAEGLRSLDEELTKISTKHSYDLAASQSPDYVQSDNFRMGFLRAETFHAAKAAKHMVEFLNVKHELFGDEVLTRPIYLSDLSQEDQEFLRRGYRQLLPFRDRAGRVVLCDIVTPEVAFQTTTSSVKTLFFMVSEAADDVESQKRGLVLVALWYLLEPDTRLLTDGGANKRMEWQIANWSPIRFRGAHICFTDPWFHAMKASVYLRTAAQMKTRIRVHVGTPVENQDSLVPFGIPVNALPMKDDVLTPKWRKERHLRWIEKREEKERGFRQNGKFEGTDLPMHADILLGRGLTYHQHPGNIKLRSIVEDFSEEYGLTSTRREKTNISWEILRKVKDTSRFLKRTAGGWWEEVEDSKAREKIAMMFRTAKSAVTAAAAATVANNKEKSQEDGGALVSTASSVGSSTVSIALDPDFYALSCSSPGRRGGQQEHDQQEVLVLLAPQGEDEDHDDEESKQCHFVVPNQQREKAGAGGHAAAGGSAASTSGGGGRPQQGTSSRNFSLPYFGLDV